MSSPSYARICDHFWSNRKANGTRVCVFCGWVDSTNAKEFCKIQKRINVLTALIQPIQNELSELKRDILNLNSKFQVGDTIEWEEGTKRNLIKVRGVVVKILPWLGDEACWRVQRILKNGSNGKSKVVRLYNNPVKL